MLSDIFFAVWFFLPAGLANMAPILVSRLPGLRRFSTPVDFNRTWRGQPVFGKHKTWRGIVSGTLMGLAVIIFQKYAYVNHAWAQDISNGLDYASLPIILGLLMGFGALAGDAIKSFFKRQFKHKSGDSWFPYDQLDYIIGGLLASLLFVTLEWAQYVWIFVVWFGLHLLASYIGYKLNLKVKPI